MACSVIGETKVHLPWSGDSDCPGARPGGHPPAVKGRSLFYVTTKQIILDAAMLSRRMRQPQIESWAAFDPAAGCAQPRIHFDRLGRGHFRITGPKGAIVVSIRLRGDDVGPRQPPAGTHRLLFWKDRRLHRLMLEVGRSAKKAPAADPPGRISGAATINPSWWGHHSSPV